LATQREHPIKVCYSASNNFDGIFVSTHRVSSCIYWSRLQQRENRPLWNFLTPVPNHQGSATSGGQRKLRKRPLFGGFS
jgi:hypothetical protein